MPWTQASATTMRMRFICDHLAQRFSFAELCRRYGISRKTGYKWVTRFQAENLAGLNDRSHRVHTCSHVTPEPIASALLKMRRHHPSWGAGKIITVLKGRHPEWPMPARCTVHDLFRRHGLVTKKRRRVQHPHPGTSTTLVTEPNALWTADFKGQFRTQDGHLCYPLTVADRFSRFLIACDALTTTSEYKAKPVFERIFRKYGLPERIRTDNGPPFATYSLGRLSRLSAWWIRLGIRPELIEPGKPQQNGAHERMHRTLKAETTRPSAYSLSTQQRRFNQFRTCYNQERPHQALEQRTPGSLYKPSPRPFPERQPPLDYPPHFEVRLVSSSGSIRWKNHALHVTTALIDHYVGLEEIDDGLWTVYYAHVELGRLNDQTLRITDLNGKENRMPSRRQ